ncbi:MAG: 16S rRNA (guanine(527)-N(7))-methyltransferase RsmG [Bacillota bacterium]|nr:MAG: 16S rRNA (guanine(527)-N(7))-methyltransferase RsmG [Bacillota bacterium]
MAEYLAVLREGLIELAGPPGQEAARDPGRLRALLQHLEEVREWNRLVNLTGITDLGEMVVKHTLDSAALLGRVPVSPGMRVLDVGTGAGFPGVVLGLLVPGVRLSLLDSLQKRCRFLEHLCQVLWPGDREVEVLWGRAEEWGHRPGYREAYDLVTARAVAEMRVLAELCLPFVRVGGRFVALKGPGGRQEVAEAARALATLGGEVTGLWEVTLPAGAGERLLVEVTKVRPTPALYPRRPGVPEKRPL